MDFKQGTAYLKLNLDCRLSGIHLNNGFYAQVGQALYKEFISIVFFTFEDLANANSKYSTHIHIHIHIHTYTHTHIHTYTFTHTYTYTYTNTHTHIHTHK